MDAPKKMRLFSSDGKKKKYYSQTPNAGIELCSMNDALTYPQDYFVEYLQLLDGKIVKEFLQTDKCCLLADRYILAIIFVYFIRAKFVLQEFTPYNFFVALYLAHDIEEDNEDLKGNIIISALCEHIIPKGIQNYSYKYFLRSRDEFWSRMENRALVSLDCCLKVIQIQPNHPIWGRYRAEVHAGANRGNRSKAVIGASEMHDICWNCNKLQKILDAEE